jgi:hypothetical protein
VRRVWCVCVCVCVCVCDSINCTAIELKCVAVHSVHHCVWIARACVRVECALVCGMWWHAAQAGPAVYAAACGKRGSADSGGRGRVGRQGAWQRQGCELLKELRSADKQALGERGRMRTALIASPRGTQ